MPDVLVPPGWFTHESGEQWYWDGWGWRGNRADFEAALTPAQVAAQTQAGHRRKTRSGAHAS